jgi:phage-related protein
VTAIRVVFYREGERVPLRDWLDALPPAARERCRDRLWRLAEMGHELRRPSVARVCSGLYELRVKYRRLNLRMLYFFHGQTIAVVLHGFVKQQAVIPLAEVRRALGCRTRFEADPDAHM